MMERFCTISVCVFFENLQVVLKGGFSLSLILKLHGKPKIQLKKNSHRKKKLLFVRVDGSEKNPVAT